MNKKPNLEWTFLLGVCLVSAVFLCRTSAQVQTQTTTTAHAPTVQTTVENAEVVYVSGNDLIVKMEDGTIRHIPNVPDSARVMVDGKELGVHDLKVGMKLQRTVTTTTTPKTVTTVQSVTGKVFHITPPTSVILILEDGSTQQFKIPKGQKFNVDGQMVDAWGLKKGMRVSATKVVEEPVVEVSQQKAVTGSMPPPPPPPADVPIIVAVATPPPMPAPAAATPEKLPKTGSYVPLIGVLGLVLLASAIGIRTFRRAL